MFRSRSPSSSHSARRQVRGRRLRVCAGERPRSSSTGSGRQRGRLPGRTSKADRRGDSAKVSRDDLVFAGGTLHIVNEDRGHPSLAVNRRTCTATFKVPKTTTVDGGTGRFAGATGTFVGAVSGSGVARRRADGS